MSNTIDNVKERRDFILGWIMYQDILDQYRKKLIESKLLERFSQGHLTQSQMRVLILTRVHIAKGFNDLLDSAIQDADKHANRLGLTYLKNELQHNLNDELGIDMEGNRLDIGSHKLRKDMWLDAFEFRDQERDFAKKFKGLNKYQEATNELIEIGSLYEKVGAIVFCEYAIPEEFKLLLAGCIKKFPDKFDLQSATTPEEHKQIINHRLYLGHHIAHDAESHFPDLIEAIKLSQLSESEDNEIRNGITKMLQRRIKYYEQLEGAL